MSPGGAITKVRQGLLRFRGNYSCAPTPCAFQKELRRH
jgi:hypothetical protein